MFLVTQDEVPWDACLYIFGHINYGGRVTDDNDRIALITNLTKYCKQESLNDNYQYSGQGIYYTPVDGDM
jgi:dynein heavy chain